MRVLGIDPGLRLTGYGCVVIDPRHDDPQLVEGGVIRLPTNASLPVRLAQLHEDLLAVIDDIKPDRMVVEQLFSHYKHARTSILMGHARGVVLLCQRLCWPNFEERLGYSPRLNARNRPREPSLRYTGGRQVLRSRRPVP